MSRPGEQWPVVRGQGSADWRNSRRGRLLVVVCLVGLIRVPWTHALPWNDDMYRQPELEAGTAARPPAARSVPTEGIEPPGSARIGARMRAGLRLRNPVAATTKSIRNGKALFGTYCATCHGPRGRGDGPMVGTVMPSSDLHTARLRTQRDGYLYATIRSGGLVMPAYGHALSVEERWDVVNYLRVIQQELLADEPRTSDTALRTRPETGRPE